MIVCVRLHEKCVMDPRHAKKNSSISSFPRKLHVTTESEEGKKGWEIIISLPLSHQSSLHVAFFFVHFFSRNYFRSALCASIHLLWQQIRLTVFFSCVYSFNLSCISRWVFVLVVGALALLLSLLHTFGKPIFILRDSRETKDILRVRACHGTFWRCAKIFFFNEITFQKWQYERTRKNLLYYYSPLPFVSQAKMPFPVCI